MARGEVPTRVSQMVGMEKVMLTMIWEIEAFHVVDMMPPGESFNTQYFLIHIVNFCWRKSLRSEGKAMHFD
jgi:hypothetical protein